MRDRLRSTATTQTSRGPCSPLFLFPTSPHPRASLATQAQHVANQGNDNDDNNNNDNNNNDNDDNDDVADDGGDATTAGGKAGGNDDAADFCRSQIWDDVFE
ncbi:hypothetical protein EDB84DRAFT_1443368 [Lactarius hengduanensis]|nr:hypothetical protein EDB84DRAFT_1443368 [Lactarius hengduanensis]